jgi:pimeloyl-ACP methyl ester carboxylesterase
MRVLLSFLFLPLAWAAPTPIDEWLAKPAAERGAAPEVSLTREQAEALRTQLHDEHLANLKGERAAEVAAKSITLGDKTLRWLEKEFGDAPAGKRSLWISMHGGGGAPTAVNDQQWRNQIKLYQPEEGIYVAPRAPTDTWDLWHQGHMDRLFDRLIADMVAIRGVDPDKIYLMGYSAGGDGVWQLAPRLADRFAAAAMMAGHPGDASLLPLRNLPFAVFMGGKDAAYNRNKLAAEKGAELAALQDADPGSYVHLVRIYEDLPHWMNLKDAEAVPWMAKWTRNPWPSKVIWVQDDVTQDRFYWLRIPSGSGKAGSKIIASVADNEITLEGDVPNGTTLDLADALVNLDAPITVNVNGTKVFTGDVKRTPAAIAAGVGIRPGAAGSPVASIPLGE